MTDKTIYDLELHEETKISGATWVIRVPGGWIYTEHGVNTAVFVPYTPDPDRLPGVDITIGEEQP